MSKIVLIFALFCIFATVCHAFDAQRVRRDVTEEAEKVWNQASEQLKDLFKKENLDKFMETAKDFGSNLKKATDDVVAKLTEKKGDAAPSA